MVNNVFNNQLTFSLYLIGVQDLFFGGEKKSVHIYRHMHLIGAASRCTAGTCII